MKKRCIINFASGDWYPIGQRRLVESILAFSDVDILTFSNYEEVNSPTHTETPYAFKLRCFHTALERGYTSVLWCDSSLYAMSNPDRIFEIIESEGYFMCAVEDHPISTCTNDKMLSYFGITRDEGENVTSIHAALIGFDFKNSLALEFFSKWEAAIPVFPGAYSNEKFTESVDPRCKGHRHDQSAASIIAYLMKLKLQPQEYIGCDSLARDCFFVQVRGILGYNACLAHTERGCPPKFPRVSLQKIGKAYQTDKSSLTHSFNGSSFLDIYDSYFSVMRNSKVKLLELGVNYGSSIRTWRDYFVNGTIVGIDVNPGTFFQEDRICIHIGSQADPTLASIIKETYESFDVIIDDGSHINPLTIKSFELYFDMIKPGGFYVIEDTHCTYQAADHRWPGMSYNDHNLDYSNKREDFNKFVENLLFEMDHKRGEIFHVHFYSETVIIKKNK
jgi:hypothetical protein